MGGTLALQDSRGLIGRFFHQESHFWMRWLEIRLNIKLLDRLRRGWSDGCNHRAAKPDPDLILKASLGCDPKQMLYLDGSGEHDDIRLARGDFSRGLL